MATVKPLVLGSNRPQQFDASADSLDIGTHKERACILTARGATLKQTNVPARTEVAGTNMDFCYLDFDATTAELASWVIMLPDNFDAASSVTAKIAWKASDANSGNVSWNVGTRSIADTGTEDSTLTYTEIVDGTQSSTTAISLTAETTITESWVAGEYIQITLKRDPADASDTYGADARFIALRLEWSTL